MPYTKENFDDWIFFLSDKMDYFTGEFAREQGLTLDYTPESLDALEHWLLGKYEKSMDLVEDKEPYGNDYRLADLCGIYVGEVYRRQLGGSWYMILDQPKNVYYKLPSLIYDTRTGPYYICPLTLATACIQRKRGDYMRWVLGNYIEDIGNARAGSADRKRASKRYGKGKNPCERSPVTLAAARIRRKRGDDKRRVLGNYIEDNRQRAGGKDLP